MTIDGAAAGFERVDGELVVTPQTPIPAGEDFVVAVTYHGSPQRVRVDSIGVDAGWTVVDGIAYVFAEPDGARTWFPGSDHPSDKATFTIVANVPRGLTAVANGELVSSASDADDSIFRWEMDQPMATYLAVLVVGDYELVDWESHGDIARRDFVSVVTVRNQVQSILIKLNVHSQLEAVAAARWSGWADPAVEGTSAAAAI